MQVSRWRNVPSRRGPVYPVARGSKTARCRQSDGVWLGFPALCDAKAQPHPSRSARGADTLTPVRVLVVTNFMPDAGAPQRGRWVRDQVDEMRRRDVEVDLFEFARGRG